MSNYNFEKAFIAISNEMFKGTTFTEDPLEDERSLETINYLVDTGKMLDLNKLLTCFDPAFVKKTTSMAIVLERECINFLKTIRYFDDCKWLNSLSELHELSHLSILRLFQKKE